MKKILKFILPVLILFISILVAFVLVQNRPKAVHKPVEIKHPLVSVAEVNSATLSVPVFTRGTVTPGTEIQLASEVGGQVLKISPNFENGGFFRKGDELLRIDPLEYDVNIKRAQANVAQARQVMLQAKAEMKARQRVKGGTRNKLATYEVQVKQAEAAFAAASAELAAAKLQKQRTVIRAPFDGRVRLKTVNLGQYVRPGMQLGAIYAVDIAEIRLPLSDRQVGLVDVPLDFDSVNEPGPMVTLVGQYGGEKYQWLGQVVRAEGGLDQRNRLLYVVAHVEDPYAKDPKQPGRPPLASGFFVDAKIKGRTHHNLFVVPRRSVRNGNQIWVVGPDNKLQRRELGVLYKGKDSIYVKSGLQNGDRVVLSQLDIAVEGMEVRTVNQEPETKEQSTTDNLREGVLGQSGKTPASQLPAAAEQSQKPRFTGITKEFSAAEIRKMASEAKKIVDSMEPEARQELTDNVQKMGSALKNAMAASQKDISTEVSENDRQPVQEKPAETSGSQVLPDSDQADDAAAISQAVAPKLLMESAK
ncbi:MAG: efflux transporter periplasmic adaptor subunit [Gammaproteobacteria bacterium]|nr:MAG: efflux transporter periplasmic adaptor subunit [Gammaproteobacteria bacterium]